MKKAIITTIIFAIILCVFSLQVKAVELNTIEVSTSKTTVNPNDEVSINVNFGTQLGAYTLNFAYDNKLFDYVSTDGGTANNTGDKVIVTFYDTTGGSNPKNSMSIKFKAKTGIETSNPTDISVTATGMASPDASTSYDDITSAIVKNVVVEPVYVDYAISLNYSGDIVKEQEKAIAIAIKSSMGKNYDHARLVAEATTPEGGAVTLTGKDSSNVEHELIQGGWGDASGYSIGGKDVNQELNFIGKFTKAGKYNITLKLIDRDSSDAVIAINNFEINVKETETAPETTKPENNTTTQPTENTNTTKPTTLPKTGYNIYVIASFILTMIIIGYLFYIKMK